MNLEKQKENFKNHLATFTDYGDIKILDFKAPDTNHYRIRFLFEETYCRLHISGDLGHLIAMNYKNMTYAHFSDFVNSVGYFESKIQCHDRPIYTYDYELAMKDIRKHLEDNDLIEQVLWSKQDYSWYSDEEKIEAFLEDVMTDFSDETGISREGFNQMSKIDDYFWESGYDDFGKEETGILDLYMLAFQLAQQRLPQSDEPIRD